MKVIKNVKTIIIILSLISVKLINFTKIKIYELFTLFFCNFHFFMKMNIIHEE